MHFHDQESHRSFYSPVLAGVAVGDADHEGENSTLSTRSWQHILAGFPASEESTGLRSSPPQSLRRRPVLRNVPVSWKIGDQLRDDFGDARGSQISRETRE